jgi:hypothetical protein
MIYFVRNAIATFKKHLKNWLSKLFREIVKIKVPYYL